jgi:hypothetical protein
MAENEGIDYKVLLRPSATRDIIHSTEANDAK